MKNTILSISMSVSLVLASMAYGAVPTMNVMVSDASGKLAFKGATKGDGGFANEKLQPGNYVVQLTSKNSGLKGGQYSIVVSAGKKKVVANSVAGEKFLTGGVAMKVEVAAGLNITGQVAAGPLANTPQKNNTMRKPGDAQESARKTMTQTPDKMPAPTSY